MEARLGITSRHPAQRARLTNRLTSRSAADRLRRLETSLSPVVNLTSMTNGGTRQPPERRSFLERSVLRVANARSVVTGLSVTFVGLAFLGAIGMRIADPYNFPSLGLAIWWALQRVTMVGYGDAVPTTDLGRVIGGVEVLGVSFIAFLTAGVTSVVIQRVAHRRRRSSVRTMSATPRPCVTRWSRYNGRSPSWTRVLTGSSRRSGSVG